MRTLLSLAVLCTSVAAAPVPKELRKSPYNQFQGKWELIKFECDIPGPADGGASGTYSIDGKTCTISSNGDMMEHSLTIDDSQLPLRITSTCFLHVQQRTYSIAKVDGDFLYECYSETPKLTFPKDFTTKDGCYLLTFKRIK